MKGPVIGIVIVLSLLSMAVIFFASDELLTQSEQPKEQSYINDALGISFSYPIGYVLSEKEVGTPQARHYVVTIFKEEDAIPHVNSEGPPAITLEFYQNNTDTKSVFEWMTRTTESNFTLGDGTYVAGTVDTAEALTYHWSGLYEGETTVFAHDKNIVTVSSTYLSRDDDLYHAYVALRSSILLY